MSLKETIHAKLKNLIQSIQKERKVLILDKSSVKVFDAAMSLPEILDAGVYLVENVHLGRQPYPQMAAIYVLEATEENINYIIRDFTPPKKKLVSGRTGPMYASAHIFLTNSLDQSLLNLIAQSPAAPYVESLEEIFINFIPAESQIFNLGHSFEDYKKLFSPLATQGPLPPSLSNLLDRAAVQIASACVSLGQVPIVRCQKSSPRAEQLAIRVQQKLDEFCGKLEMKVNRSATLLIIDRTFDLVAPLLHEFTVQAMANDLIGLGPDGAHYSYSFSTAMGSQKKSIVLDEVTDSLWQELRHAHIADCSQLIIEKFNKFISENKAALKSRNSSSKTPGEVVSLSELKDTMAALGEFHELKAQFALHLSLAQDCLSRSDSKSLIEITGIEQNMVMGVDEEGEPVQDAWPMLSQALVKPNLTSKDRTRLLAIYLLTLKKKLNDTEKKALIEAAKLDSDDNASLRHLIALAGSQMHNQRQSLRPKSSKRKTCLDQTPKYDVSRFQPALKLLLEDFINDEVVCNGEFPSMKPTDGQGEAASRAPPPAPAASLRAKSTTSASGPSSIGGLGVAGGKTVFAYVLGGCTYSEMRSGYELSTDSTNVFIGSDHFLTPESFLAMLKP